MSSAADKLSILQGGLGTGPTTRPISHATNPGNNMDINAAALNRYMDGYLIDNGLVAYNQVLPQAQHQLMLSNSAMLRAGMNIQKIKIDTNTTSKVSLEKNSIFSKDAHGSSSVPAMMRQDY